MPVAPSAEPFPAHFNTRSFLVIPAAEDAAIAAGLRSGADVLVADLASMAADLRPEGATRARQFLEARSGGKPLPGDPAFFIRLPPARTLTADFLRHAGMAAADGAVLSGSPDIAAVQQLDVMLGVEEALAGRPAGHIRILAEMALPPRQDMAGISHRLLGFGWTAEGLLQRMGARRMHDGEGRLTDAFRQARAGVLLAGHMAGLEVVDTSSGLFSASRLQRDCHEAADDGFTGKFALSPRQVPTVNLAFSPDEVGLAEARALLAETDADPALLRRARMRLARALPDVG